MPELLEVRSIRWEVSYLWMRCLAVVSRFLLGNFRGKMSPSLSNHANEVNFEKKPRPGSGEQL